LPTGPLMIEHRLIEKMVSRLAQEGKNIRQTGNVDIDFLDDAIDFIRTYADRCHHGKEEDILFRDLRKKEMPPDLASSMERLIEEHKRARALIGRIDDAKERYRKGDRSAKEEIAEAIEEVTALYPKHIEDEDKRFFPKAMELFTREEKDAMIAESYDFDRKLIHEKYAKVYERWSAK